MAKINFLFPVLWKFTLKHYVQSIFRKSCENASLQQNRNRGQLKNIEMYYYHWRNDIVSVNLVKGKKLNKKRLFDVQGNWFYLSFSCFQ